MSHRDSKPTLFMAVRRVPPVALPDATGGQYVEGLSGESARLRSHVQACRSSESAIVAEAFMDNAGSDSLKERSPDRLTAIAKQWPPSAFADRSRLRPTKVGWQVQEKSGQAVPFFISFCGGRARFWARNRA